MLYDVDKFVMDVFYSILVDFCVIEVVCDLFMELKKESKYMY